MEFVFLALFAVSIVAYIFIKKAPVLAITPAALVALVMQLLCAPPFAVWITFAVFTLITLGVILVLQTKKESVSDFRSVVGSRCRVLMEIDNYAGRGAVKVNGQIWAARAVSDEDVYDVGETLSVVAIEGVRLVCRK